MSVWISWNDIHDEKMKDPVYKAEFEKGYAEFHRQNALDLAAEQAAAGRTRTILFARRKTKRTTRPAITSRKAVEA